MLCEKCGQKEATFYYEETINGNSQSWRLCADCAALQKNGEDPFSSFHKLLDGDIFFGSILGASKTERPAGHACPSCGATLADFMNSSKAGCPGCYSAFERELTPSIRRIHGRSTHTGASPRRFREENEKKQKIAGLEKALKEAIASEEYEKAAGLRDEIRALKQDNSSRN